ncbi:hypothetical protein [Bacillus cereus]|uniref:hypothetical protein n=1 Tax=Bacillus cereus TaxID=1396 RepID=UPI0008641597|nr:hypothetical protein [Bacillus cereus]SCN01524.1 Protein of unknown function [Bacillus wiedmannii]
MRAGSTEDGGDCEGASGGLSFVLERGESIRGPGAFLYWFDLWILVWQKFAFLVLE